MTLNRLICVGNGIGPETTAPVRSMASTICPAAWSTSLWSNPFILIRIFCLGMPCCPRLLTNFSSQPRRQLLITMEFHRVGSPSLSFRPQAGSITETLGQRYHGMNSRQLAAGLDGADL